MVVIKGSIPLQLTNLNYIIMYLHIILILLSLIGFCLHCLSTYHKSRFSKKDIVILTVLFISFLTPILLLMFNFK